MDSEYTDLKEENYKAAHRVTLVGTASDTLLTIAKLVVGFTANSAALIAEGLHSGADLLFDLVVLVGLKLARRKPDDDHPYGHGKFESLATLLLALLLLGVAVGIMWDAGLRLRAPELNPPGALALLVAAFSMVFKEFLYQYTVRIGRRINSKITIANAWHHRGDAIASGAALIGIAGAVMGWPMADPIAAIGVAFFVGKIGIEIAHSSLKELTDAASAVDKEVRATIAELVEKHPEVHSAHLLKLRRLGPDIVVDVHVVVNPFLSVSEGHQIADQIEIALFNEVKDISAVMVHVDTEDDQDETKPAVPIFPDRAGLLAMLQAQGIEPPLVGFGGVVPHYTSEGLVLDLVLTAPDSITVAAARQAATTLGNRVLRSYAVIERINCRLDLGTSTNNME